MRELSPVTKANYKTEFALYERLKKANQVEAHLSLCKKSTRLKRVLIWNKYCNANLEVPYGKITFEPKNIPHKELQRFKDFVSGYCNEDQRLFIDLGLRLGLRLAEILSINRDSIREGGISIMRKGGKVQILPCPEDLLERIRISNGCKFQRRYYQELMSKIAKLTSIKISTHGLRHTFATEAVRENCNPYLLRDAMGHENINMTMQYVHVDMDQLRSIIK